MPAPDISYGDNNETLSSLSVSLPFDIPSYVNDTIKLMVTFNNSMPHNFDSNNLLTFNNTTITVDLSNINLGPGNYNVKYSLSFFNETPEESKEAKIAISEYL